MGIGYAAPVAHKTGTKDWVYNDAAMILLPDNPFVLVILTKGVPSRVQSTMRQIAHDMYQYELKRKDGGEAQLMAELRAWLDAWPR